MIGATGNFLTEMPVHLYRQLEKNMIEFVPKKDSRMSVDRIGNYEIITGGDVDTGTLVTEDWLLKLERKAFVELIGHPKTMERIMGILQNGKPVRN